jgi:hypothetical protein
LPAHSGFVTDATVTDLDIKFMNYVAQFNKSYATAEDYAARKAIFNVKDL